MARAGHVEVRKIDGAEAARRLAWQGGQISFQGETLAEAIGEFNRYSRRQMALADPELGTLRVGGSFKTTDIDSFAAALQSSFGLHADEEGRDILVIRREPRP
jgi:transmembrane sensor